MTTTTRPTPRWVPALLGAGALLLASCGTGAPTAGEVASQSPSPSSSTSDAPSPSPTATETTAAPSPTATASPSAAGSALQGAEGSAIAPAEEFTTADTQGGNGQAGGDLLPIEVRSADHENHARVVVEFQGTTGPGFVAGYVPEAVEQGRGDVISVPGGAILAVTMRGLTMPTTDAEINAMVSGALTSKASIVEGLYLDPFFEGQGMLYIGLDTERPYAISTLADPQRLVIDIRTD